MTKEELKKMSFRDVLLLLKTKGISSTGELLDYYNEGISFNNTPVYVKMDIKLDLTKDIKDQQEEVLQAIIKLVK